MTAMSGKSKKFILKRFRETRSGKILRRPSGLDHFNARAASGVMRRKRKEQNVLAVDRKAIRNYP